MNKQSITDLVQQRKHRLEEAGKVLPYICLSLKYTNPDHKAISSNLCNLSFAKKGFQSAPPQELSKLTSDDQRDLLSGNALLTYRMLEALFELGCLKYAEESLSDKMETPHEMEKAHREQRRRIQDEWVDGLPAQEATLLKKLLENDTSPIDSIEFMRMLHAKLPSEPQFFAVSPQPHGNDYTHPMLYEMMLLSKPRSKDSSSERGVNVKTATSTIVGLLRVGAYEMARHTELFGPKKHYHKMTDNDINQIVEWTFELLYKDTFRPFGAMDDKDRPGRPLSGEPEVLKSMVRLELSRLRQNVAKTDWLASVKECETASMDARRQYNKAKTPTRKQ